MTLEDRLTTAFRALEHQHDASPEAWQAIQQGKARRRHTRVLGRIGLAVAPLLAVGGIGLGASEVFTPAGQPVRVGPGPGSTTTFPVTSVPVSPTTAPTTATTSRTGATLLPVVNTATPLPTATLTPPTAGTVGPAPTSPPSPPTLGTAEPAGGVITGTVVDSSGKPVAGAYVIGLDTLTVARTDASGRFEMSCLLAVNGILGKRSEPLVAGAWLLPVERTGQGGYTYGRDTTMYGPPPTAAGLGYAFSGGSPDAAGASIVSCGGPPPRFVLPSGGGVDIEFVDKSGAPLAYNANGIPVDNLYLPGLGDHAALETAPLSGGHQIVQQLGPGTLQIDGTATTLSCQGPGVTADPNAAGATVTVTPGTTTRVVCTT